MPEANENIEGFDRPDQTQLVDVPKQLGIYRLSRLLGRGGMGEVWLAHDTKLERDVAVKLMRRELLANEEAVKRFYREARAVARLNHPNIVQAYSIGEEHGLIYYVMEMVEGETVTERLRRVGPFPLADAINVVLQTINGLDYAFVRGVVHRDIKPSNLMLTEDFRIKIADFGLAKLLETDTHMTATGVAMGSPNYMSPEQARGEEADHRSDIYALGITLFQVLTNELPFTASTPISVLLRQIQDQLPEPEILREMSGGAVLEAIKKMTAKSADDRFQTYGGLAAALNVLAPDIHVPMSGHSITTTLSASQEGQSRSPASDASAASESLAGETVAQGPTQIGGTSEQLAKKSNLSLIAILGSVGLVALILVAAITYLLTRGNGTGEVPPLLPPEIEVSQGPATVAQPPQVAPTVVAQPVATQTPAISVTPATSVPTPQTAAPATPAPTVVPTMSFTPVPTPEPVKEVLVGPNLPRGAKVNLLDENNTPIASVEAGSFLTVVRLDKGPNGNTRFVVRNGEQLAYLPFSDGSPQYGTAAVSASALPTVETLKVVLGTGDGKAITIYTDKNLRRKIKELPSGTKLTATEEPPIGFRVVLPDNREGFVIKGDAKPVQ
ncbi:hypothetical protein CVU37_03760 [candidate division BRC1 bacterium HGW-BRC1-1]|jgi:serine/threonine protein kinase|nr:MAG: hypothetical protein CVU37_03760 [candidate division BRC1 bacterium HGW-BRC1-1]